MGGAEGFGGEGDEDEGDVGVFLAEEGELGEEVAAYAAGAWSLCVRFLGFCRKGSVFFRS